jgi:hypothetical protein
MFENSCATAAQEIAQSQLPVEMRLAAGGEIDLIEALHFKGVRRSCEVYKLEGLRVRGRAGGPLEPVGDVPSEVFAHLRWKMVDAIAVLETPEGQRVYDVRCSAVERQAVGSLQVASVPAEISQVSDAHPTDMRLVEVVGSSAQPLADINDVLARIATWEVIPDTVRRTMQDVISELRTAGVTIGRKGYVAGIGFRTGGLIERAAAGQRPIWKVLMTARLRHLRKSGEVFEGMTKRDVVRMLNRWLNEAFEGIAPSKLDDADADNVVRDFKKWGVFDAELVSSNVTGHNVPSFGSLQSL